MDNQIRVLIDGQARGYVLRLEAPISFWGGVDTLTGAICLPGHPQFGTSIDGKILIIPELIGSSSSSAVMLELLHQDTAPAALILGAVDAILPIGILAGQQMDLNPIPVLQWERPPFVTGDIVSVSEGGLVEKRSRVPRRTV